MFVDLNLVVNEQDLFRYPDSMVIFIGDCRSAESQKLLSITRGLEGMAFNPSIEASQAYIEGDVNDFIRLYSEYLKHEQNVNSYLLSIVQATTILKKSVVLYIDQSSYNMYYQILANYMRSSFGITVGDRLRNIPGQVDDNYLPQLYYNMYHAGDLSIQDFLQVNRMPVNDMRLQDVLLYAYFNNIITAESYLVNMCLPTYPDTLVNKLLNDLGLNNIFTNEQGYIRLLNIVKQDIINNGGQFVRRPHYDLSC